MALRTLVVALTAAAAVADDPASSWLVYAIAPGNGTRVTSVNATWVVPSYPTDRNAPNAPGYWFGIEPRPADMLIQPILGEARYASPILPPCAGLVALRGCIWPCMSILLPAIRMAHDDASPLLQHTATERIRGPFSTGSSTGTTRTGSRAGRRPSSPVT